MRKIEGKNWITVVLVLCGTVFILTTSFFIWESDTAQNLTTNISTAQLENSQSLKVTSHELRELVYSTLAITASYHVEKSSEISIPNLLSDSFESLQVKCPLSSHQETTLMEITETVLGCALTHSSEHRVDLKQTTIDVLNFMLASLDPHSRLLDEQETQELKEATQGEFAGIGVEVLQKDGVLSIMKVFEGSPAQKAGLKPQDEILAVNGKTTFTQSMDEIVEGMRGLVGSMADLLILHSLEKSPAQIRIIRDQITVRSATLTKTNRTGIPVLKIESFSLNTAKEAKELLSQHEKSTGKLEGLILDLRGNPGGLLQQAVELADLFLDHGKIVSIDGYEAETHSAKKSAEDYLTQPIMVLIDSQSASASEIVAGALQDNKRAIVLGERSFGKGSVQTVFELTSTNALKLTIARYYTPENRSIQNLGIEPDVWLQGLEKRNENTNLLGETRLVREGLLAKTLKNPDSKAKETGKTRYYLIESTLNSGNLGAASETLLSVALQALIQCNVKSTIQISDIKSNPLPCINGLDSIGDASASALKWLQDRHNVNWSTPSESAIQIQASDFDFQTDLSFNEKSHSYELNWKLRNKTNDPKPRVAVFVSSKKGHFQNIERLLGKLNPREELSGSFPVLIDDKETNQLDTLSGLSIDSHILVDTIQEISKPIDQPLADTLRTFVRLSELNRDSRLKAELEITVENPNNFSLQDIKLSLKSLAGNHLDFTERAHFISEIPAKSSRTISTFVHSDSSTNIPLKFGIATQRSDNTLTRRNVYDFLTLLNKSGIAH